MSGLLFLASLVAVLFVCAAFSNAVGNHVAKPLWKAVVKAAVFVAMMSAPFVDELIGKRQFEALCSTNGIDSADLSKATGRQVKAEYGGRIPVEGTVLPTLQSEVAYRDAATGVVLMRHMNYYSGGGWLMRYTWLSMGSNHPMLFGGNGCGFESRERRFTAANISVVH